MANPSLTQLKRAVEISEKIQALKAELNSLLGGSGSADSAPKKRGRGPGRKPGKKAAAQAASDDVSALPKKRGRKPGSKNVVKAANAAAGPVKKKRVMSPEAREKIAAAQRKRWAKMKKAPK